MFSSCAQLTRLDTGRTVGKGNIEMGPYITAYGANSTSSQDLGPAVLPIGGIQASYGITEKIDFNASFNLSGNLYLNPKFQIVGDRESALAIALLPGGDIQFRNFDNDESTVFFRPHFSAIISLHQDEWAFFAEPKYIYQGIKEKDSGGAVYVDASNFIGTTLGVEYLLNGRTKFALGYSLFSVRGENQTTGSRLYNIGLGMKRRIGE